MNIAGSLNYDTKIDTKGLDEGINKSKTSTKGWADSFKVAVGNIMADMARMATQGLKEIAQAGITYNAQIEKYQTALTTLTGSAEEANKIIGNIKKDAASTPFNVESLVSANQLLISAGVNSERAREDIMNLANAISATGGGSEELSRMAVNLQQVKNIGKASALDIKQFAYAGIDVYGLLADATGKTREEVSQLDVTYEDLTNAFKYAASEGGKYEGALKAQSQTFNGLVSTLKDNLNAFIGETMTPLFTILKDDVLPTLLQIIQGGGDTEELIANLTDKITAFIGDTIQKMINSLPQILDIGIQVITNLIKGIGKQLPTLIPTIVNTIVLMVDTFVDNVDMIIDAGIELLLGLVDGIMEAVPTLIEKIPEIIGKLVTALTNPTTLEKLITAGIKLLLSVGAGLVKAVPEVLKLIPSIIKNMKDQFVQKIKETDWKQLGKNILNGILEGITKFGNAVKEAAKKLFNEVKNKVKSFFGISSPAKAMMPLGGYITQGVAVGIEAKTDSVDDAIDDLNNEIMDKMTRAVNVETGKVAYSGTNGTITQMLSAFGTTTVINDNKLYLDGDQVYENQQTVSAKKNLQTQFGGGYSVSS